MNRLFLIISIFILGLFVQTDCWGQTVQIDSVFIAQGETGVVEVNTDDFTRMEFISMTIEWDPTLIRYLSVFDINDKDFPNLGFDNFDGSEVANGKLSLTWADDGGTDQANFLAFFKLDFEAIGPVGISAPIRVLREGLSLQKGDGLAEAVNDDVFALFEHGNVSIRPPANPPGNGGNTPAVADTVKFDFNTTGELLCINQQMCYSLLVEGFDSILTFTAPVTWNTDVLQFSDLDNYNLEGLTQNSVRFIGEGALLITHDITIGGGADVLLSGVTVPDGTAIIDICFNVIGANNFDPSLITIGNSDLITNQQEVVDKDAEFLELKSTSTPFESVNCDELIILNTTCSKGIPGETVCVNVTAANFNNVGNLLLPHEWDADVMEFVELQSVNSELSGLAIVDEQQGSISLSWTGTEDISLTGPSTTLYALCFRLKETAIEGQKSPVTINVNDGFIGSLEANYDDIRITDDCSIEVEAAPLPEIVLSASDGSVNEGSNVCVNISVENFQGITSFEFPIVWDPAVLAYTGKKDEAFPGIFFDESDSDQGKLRVRWDEATSATLPNMETLFAICFEAIGAADTPTGSSAIAFPSTTAEPVLFSIGTTELNSNADNFGTVELINVAPSAVTFSSNPMSNIKRNTAVCVPITVNGFIDILSLQYSVEWDSTVLRFDSLKQGTLQDVIFGEVNNGLLNLSWFDEDFEGITLSDGETLAEICFTTIGTFGDQTTLDFTEGERGTEIKNAAEDDLVLINSGKEISITPFGIVSVQQESPSCAQSNGSIRVEMTGGTSRYLGLFNVKGNAIESNGTLNNPFITLENVSADFGEVCLTVVDAGNPSLNADDCFTIEINDDRVPIALAGPDLPAGCVDPDSVMVLLEGDFEENSSGSTSGGSIDYEWSVLDGSGGGIDVFGTTNTTAIATAPGTYILKITNGDGCVDTDTMMVVPSELPEISAENPELITCRNEAVILTGEGEQRGDEFVYEWKNEAGEVISDEDPFEIRVSEGGVYTFAVENTENNCKNEQEVQVRVDIETPMANAGGNKVKGCDDLTITLDGSESSKGATIEYDWVPGPDAKNGVINPNSQTPQVTATGSFILTVQNRLNGCTSVDTMEVIADRELPVARVVDKAFIGCSNAPATLDGTDSSPGSQFSYTWIVNGLTVSDKKTATVRDTGEYLLIVINEENDNCVADTARVRVSEDQTMPTVEKPDAITIGCDADCIDATISTDNEGAEFTYQWLTEEGVICGGANSLTAQISSIGLYRFIITNTANNCSDTSNVVVLADSENNAFSDAGAPREITCLTDSTTLNGTGSSQGVNIIYEWRVEEEPTIISTEMTAMVTTPGTYQLTVLDTVSGCENVSSVLVTENKATPEANAGRDIQIDGCQFPPNFRLDGSNSDSGEDIVAAWTSSGGEIKGDTSILSPNIGAPGIYTLTVLNTETGCSASDEVVVSSEMFTPIAFAGEDLTIDCTNNTVFIDANSSEVNDGIIIEWTTEDGHILLGETTLEPAVDSAGTYVLTLTTVDGCTDSDEVRIDLNATLPMVDAGADFRILCNEPTMIDATNSSTGPNISATWTTTDGNILSGANDLFLEIGAGGTYVLTIIDSTSNCRAMDEVFVDSDGELPNAQAGANQEVCSKDAVLSAMEVREGITGRWTTANGGAIVADNSPETSVSNLDNGDNLFIWTLSTEECPAFSVDSIMVNVATLPNASEDIFELTAGQELATLDLIENDRTTTASFDINLLSEPTVGNLSEITEGVFEFSIPERFLGAQEFEYEICSQTCADVCDNALVKINVRPVLDSINVNPNAITPNGDGLNDVLTFDALYFEDFPDSELVVFNRWGDIIYRVSPYNNDWSGQATDGTNLPAGTYYYVLRLDISEGEIIRGDVTILK